MAIMSAFQAEDEGLIPFTCSRTGFESKRYVPADKKQYVLILPGKQYMISLDRYPLSRRVCLCLS